MYVCMCESYRRQASAYKELLIQLRQGVHLRDQRYRHLHRLKTHKEQKKFLEKKNIIKEINCYIVRNPDLTAYFPGVSVGEVVNSHLQYSGDVR